MSAEEPARRSRFIGVDFSGAAKAGNAIWIATLERTRDRLALTDLRCAADLPGGGAERTAALAALREFIASEAEALVGLDFPFGLPRSLVDEEDWPRFIERFEERFGTADGMRASLTERAGGRELKRRTDIETKTPMSPYNLRLYRQTFWGITGVLAPLILEGRAICLPMQRLRAGLPALVETCPASLLKRAELAGSYKGRADAAKAQRRALLRALERRFGLHLRLRSAGRVIVDDIGGDALDAVIAGVAVAHASARSPRDFRAPLGGDYAIEARVII